MNGGIVLAVLGVLGVAIGAVMYVTGWHHTIGLGGMALGVVLLVGGVWLSRGTSKKSGTQVMGPKNAWA